MLATRVIANTDSLREIAPRVAGKLVANCDRPQYRDRSNSSTEAFRTEKQLKTGTRRRRGRSRHVSFRTEKTLKAEKKERGRERSRFRPQTRIQRVASWRVTVFGMCGT